MKLRYFIAIAFFVSLGVVIFGEAGLISAYKLSQENARFESRVVKLEQDNAKLRIDMEAVKSNRTALEHAIRERLSLVANDELLFEFQ